MGITSNENQVKHWYRRKTKSSLKNNGTKSPKNTSYHGNIHSETTKVPTPVTCQRTVTPPLMTSSTPSSRRCCKCTHTLKHDETAAALFGASTDSNGDGVGVFYFYDYYSNEMRNVRIYYDSIFLCISGIQGVSEVLHLFKRHIFLSQLRNDLESSLVTYSVKLFFIWSLRRTR